MTLDAPKFAIIPIMPFGNVIIAVIIFDVLFSIYCLYSWYTDKSLREVSYRGSSLRRFLSKYGFLIFALILEVIISVVIIGLYVLQYIPILGW